jgi:uncharacterized protein (TIGR02271 family)
MSRTITAMFDSRSEAEAARDQLRTTTGADAQILDQSSSSSGDSGQSRGFWAGLKDAFVADEDRPSYEEGVRRGGFLLCATVDEAQADQACSVLESAGSVDFDSRESQWRNEGWQPQASSGQQSGGFQGQRENFGGGQTGERAVEEERIPIVEEQLSVGKREVNRGGAKVRSYVRETPVSEQVHLRQEDVNIERRPVDQPISSNDRGALFQDREVEMRATSEEAVIGKEARVTEEVVVQKTAGERTENVEDTVRHTEVEVDENDRSSSR